MYVVYFITDENPPEIRCLDELFIYEEHAIAWAKHQCDVWDVDYKVGRIIECGEAKKTLDSVSYKNDPDRYDKIFGKSPETKAGKE